MEIGEKSFLFECKENDNNIRVGLVDGELDEFWFSNAIKDSWLVFGVKDLKEALSLCGYTITSVKDRNG